MNSIWSDDGVALHLPDADAPPPVEDLLVDPGELDELVLAELAGTALFGARFRENAARALIPRRRPGERTPLWQQRLKAQALLQVARRYPDFPVILETVREVLQDVFDLPALRELLAGLQQRRVDLVAVETPTASPYASSLLLDYVATYMYEDDAPLAERRAQALALDRDLLKELLGQEELRDLIDPGRWSKSRPSSAASRREPTRSTTCCFAAATWRPVSSTRLALRSRPSGARYGSGWAARAADRGRGCGPLPRRARRDAALGASRTRSWREARRRSGRSLPGTPAAAALHDRAGRRAVRRGA